MAILIALLTLVSISFSTLKGHLSLLTTAEAIKLYSDKEISVIVPVRSLKVREGYPYTCIKGRCFGGVALQRKDRKVVIELWDGDHIVTDGKRDIKLSPKDYLYTRGKEVILRYKGRDVPVSLGEPLINLYGRKVPVFPCDGGLYFRLNLRGMHKQFLIDEEGNLLKKIVTLKDDPPTHACLLGRFVDLREGKRVSYDGVKPKVRRTTFVGEKLIAIPPYILDLGERSYRVYSLDLEKLHRGRFEGVPNALSLWKGDLFLSTYHYDRHKAYLYKITDGRLVFSHRSRKPVRLYAHKNGIFLVLLPPSRVCLKVSLSGFCMRWKHDDGSILFTKDNGDIIRTASIPARAQARPVSGLGVVYCQESETCALLTTEGESKLPAVEFLSSDMPTSMPYLFMRDRGGRLILLTSWGTKAFPAGCDLIPVRTILCKDGIYTTQLKKHLPLPDTDPLPIHTDGRRFFYIKENTLYVTNEDLGLIGAYDLPSQPEEYFFFENKAIFLLGDEILVLSF